MEKDTKKKTNAKTSSVKKTTKTNATKKNNSSKKMAEKKNTNKKQIIIEEPKEEVVKEVKKEEKGKKIVKNLETIDNNRTAVYAFIVGLLIGLLILVIVWPERIAKLKDGTEPVVKYGKTTITADDLYKDMKDYYSVSILLDKIDTDLLGKLYPEDKEMKDSVNETYDSYISYYTQAGYTEEQFLSGNGFSSKKDFLKILKLDYRRNKYLDDYLKNSISDKDIKDYYKENVFGDIDSKHILVKVGSGENSLSDDEAKELAEEIISKLDDGMTFEEAKEEYEDKITYEELGYQSFNASLESSYMDALKELGNDEYTKEPVKTSYGYHVIYRIDQKDKPKQKDVKDEIIDILVAEKKAEDSNILYKALISLREENKLTFSDTNLKKKYNTYINSIEKD